MRKWTIALTAAALAMPLGAVVAGPVVAGAPAASAASAASAAKAAPAASAYPGDPDPTPVMGWSGWSFLRMGTDTAQIKGEAKGLVTTGLARFGYRYVNIDDGWYQCPGPQGPNVDKYGRWVVNTAAYPRVHGENGIKALASYVHHLGLKFGIYLTPGISKQAVAKNTPIRGTTYTADDIATTSRDNNYNCGGMVGIDYTKPGAQAFVNSIVDELASWGVDYIKLDGIKNSNGPDLAAWQAAIQQSGRTMVLNATQGSYTIKLAPTLDQYANQWEFTPDIEINGPDEGSANACNAPPFTGCLSVFPLTSYDWWSSTRFDGVADWQPYGGPGGFNDYDSIEVGDGSADSGMSLAASESQLSLWSLGSAPLILGSDLTTKVTNAYGTSAGITRRDFSLLTNRQMLEVDRDAIDASRIVDVGTPGTSPGDQVFAKVEHNGDAVVGLFNTTTTLSSSPVTITTTAAALGLPADPRGYLVEDMWGRHSVVAGGARVFRVSSAGVISATVPAEGVAFYRVIPIGSRH
jgi:hypothetical protein